MRPTDRSSQTPLGTRDQARQTHSRGGALRRRERDHGPAQQVRRGAGAAMSGPTRVPTFKMVIGDSASARRASARATRRRASSPSLAPRARARRAIRAGRRRVARAAADALSRAPTRRRAPPRAPRALADARALSRALAARRAPLVRFVRNEFDNQIRPTISAAFPAARRDRRGGAVNRDLGHGRPGALPIAQHAHARRRRLSPPPPALSPPPIAAALSPPPSRRRRLATAPSPLSG